MPSKLYEYWVFLQVYLELKRMGFDDADDSKGFLSILDTNTFRIMPEGYLHLKGKYDLYTYRRNTVEVKLYYEYRSRNNNEQLCFD